MRNGRAADPGRDIAQIALSNTGYQPGAMLEAVIRYAVDQLCWNRSTNELEAFLSSLTAILDEEAA